MVFFLVFTIIIHFGFSELCFGEFLFITWSTIMFNAGTFENVAELFDIE